MEMERVLVNVPIRSYRHNEDGTYAVRSSHLALTAYGRTQEAALERFEQLFQRFIARQRRLGRLAWVLNRSGLDWQWENASTAHVDIDGWTDMAEERERALVA